MKTILSILPIWPTLNPPYGVYTVESSLKRRGIEASVIDLNAIIYNQIPQSERELIWGDFIQSSSSEYIRTSVLPQIIPYLKKAIPHFIDNGIEAIGFSLFGPNRLITVYFIMLLKRLAPDIFIFIGGPEVTVDEGIKELLEQGLIDAAIIGEGDHNVADLIESRFKNVPDGVWVKDKPFSPSQTVQASTIGITDLSEVNIDLYSYKALPIMFARGCTSRCAFCTEAPFWGKYRIRSAEEVVSEMVHNSQSLKLNRFMFCDSLLNGDRKKLVHFLDLLIDCPTKFEFMAFLKADDSVDKELVKRLKQAGMYDCIIGFESGSDRVLASVNKGTHILNYQRTVDLLSAEKITINALFINGLPRERFIDYCKTIIFIIKNRKKLTKVNIAPTVYIASPSPMYRFPEKFGIKLADDKKIAVDAKGEWSAPKYFNYPLLRRIQLMATRVILHLLGLKS